MTLPRHVLLALLVAPACWPLLHGLHGVWLVAAGHETLSAGATIWPDGRVRALLLDSVMLAVGAGLGATALGAVVGLSLVMVPRRAAAASGGSWARVLALVLLASFCLGSVVHLMAWRGVLGAVGLDLQGWLPGLGVLSWRYAPLAAAVLAAGLAAADAGELDAAAVAGGPVAAWRMARRRLLALMGLAVAAVAVLVFGEAELPPLLGLRVYAEEFLSQVALEPSAGAAAALGWPMMAAALAAAWLLARLPIGVASTDGAVTPGWIARWSWARMSTTRVVRAAALLAAGLPIALLVIAAFAATGRWPAGTTASLGNSLAVAVVTALAACAWGLALASAAARAGPRTLTLLRGTLLLSMVWPSSLTGLALAGVAWPAWLGERTPLVAAHLLRVLPFVSFVLVEARRLLPQAGEDQLSLLGLRGLAVWNAWRRVRGPALAGALLAGLGVAVGLSLAELSATVLTVPPGFETVILRLYNLLHYGDQRGVMALALMQSAVVVAAVSALALFALVARLVQRRHAGIR